MCVVTVSPLLFLEASSPSPTCGSVHLSVSVWCQLCVVLYFAYMRMYACLVQALWCCTQPCGDMLPLSTCTGVCISTVSYTEQDYQSRGEQVIKEVYLCACVHVGACVYVYDASQFLAGKAIVRPASMCTCNVYMHTHRYVGVHTCSVHWTILANGLVVQ